MSQLKAELVKVEVEEHPNADRLDVIKIKGWQCVSQKGLFKSGDVAVYLPIDSVLPEALVAQLGIEKYYSKRLRTVKLRGMISQGMCAKLDVLPPGTYPGPRGSEKMPTVGDDVTEVLGITKYEPPIPVCMQGKVRSHDSRFVRYTDIENFKNFPDVYKEGEMVAIHEKIHGTNARAAKIEGELHVGSHNTNLLENKDNLYWRGAAKLKLEDTLKEGEQVFFEIFGSKVQDLAYGMKDGEIAVAIFDFMKGGKYLGYVDFGDVLTAYGDWAEMNAPLLYSGPWSSDLVRMATGDSLWCPGQVREGCVVRPLKEEQSEALQGRKILKIINDDYLLRKDKPSEYH